MIAYQQDRKDFEKLVESKGPISERDLGELVISELLICHTCAFYVGQWCAEVMDFGNGNEWVFQPYDRCTDYMSEKDARSMLVSMTAEETIYWDEERNCWVDLH